MIKLLFLENQYRNDQNLIQLMQRMQMKSSNSQLNYKQSQMLLPFVCFIFCLVLSACQISPIDYIWINYDAKVAVTSLGNGTSQITIPCQARIGNCQPKYSLLPMGWSASPDGTITLPDSDLSKPGGFSVKGSFTDIFGDVINQDLVAFIEDNVLSVADRTQFLQSNGYDGKTTSSMQLNPVYNIKKTQNLPGFPTLEEMQSIIKEGNAYGISTKLKDISDKYAPCQAKLPYLKQVFDLLNSKISQIATSLKNSEADLSGMMSNIANLQAQRKDMENSLNNDSSYVQVKSKLATLIAAKSEATTYATKYEFLANKYMTEFKKANGLQDDTNKTDQNLIKSMEQELNQLNQVIAKNMQKKKQLEDSIKAKKTNISKKSNNQSKPNQDLLNMYESKYREYSDLATDAKIKMKTIDQQISSANSRLNIRNADITALDQKLKDAKQKLADKQSASSLQAQADQANTNQILKLSADNMQNRINMLTASQCGYL